MSAVVVVAAAAVGAVVGVLVNRAAGRFPWPPGAAVRDLVRPGAAAVRPPLLEVGAALLFALTAVRFGPSAPLPAFLFLTGAGVLLAVVDLRHRLLPNRVVLPSLAAGAVLLVLPAVLDDAWPALLRAVVGAGALFAAFLVLALVSPSGLGMGDVKLAAVVGLYLGWLGWPAVVLGAAAGFVVQAAVAVGLLATRRIGLRGELPFGPAMLAGAALAIGWSALVA
ncbi:prepilin peptidase [Geodermatophilus sabuli]|uniref:Leader peptidase (Prepilin peptidase) / N-methyltransferase n=1 Tax=Geodermatophilus sabuli TaxID=1564158 RepID=A0A285E7G3_9ACTN|nr:A24 family peptidase [Geodermatophilus sabuli]MBB3082247.1 leader peptidase (prepilin peptidase)/N-methyltransferase [Geodermatophilus sabuli]SNX94880.1 leader peptidase (prepilin peptidase) / N-methyltransferase [Geodermatophilus sabuli]